LCWPPRGMEASPLGARRTSRLQLVAHGSGRTKAEARSGRRYQKTGVVLSNGPNQRSILQPRDGSRS
jgi:hypothetical protein